ncbi:zinc finger protein 426-like isoform X2 [Cynocephalus volans]
MLENYKNLAFVGCQLFIPRLISWLKQEELRTVESGVFKQCEIRHRSKQSALQQEFFRKQTSDGIPTASSCGGGELCDCKQCGEVFREHSPFKTHVKTQNQGNTSECNHNGKDIITLHKKTSIGQRLSEFDQSRKVLSPTPSLAVLLQILNARKPYKCKECGKGFKYLACLENHLQTHSGQKPYECKECGKAFTRFSGLIRHIRTHTGEKSFECTECGKAFLSSSHCAKHLKTHSGEKLFVCEICGKAFICSSSLNIHIRAHTGEKPFVCEHCGKAFAVSSSLSKHTRIHTGE